MAGLRRLIDYNAMDILENVNVFFENKRRFRQRSDPFELNNTEFIRLFRLNKDAVQKIIDIVAEFSDPISRKSELDAEQKVKINIYYIKYVLNYTHIHIYIQMHIKHICIHIFMYIHTKINI